MPPQWSRDVVRTIICRFAKVFDEWLLFVELRNHCHRSGVAESNRWSITRYFFSNFLRCSDEAICQVSIVLVELYRRSGVSLLDKAIRILGTSPPQRSESARHGDRLS
jgi:hypothetical protein